MSKIKRSRSRRCIQLIITVTSFLILVVVLVHLTSSRISAQDVNSKMTYKYYTSHYIEAGESLWSIANEYITQEYRSVDAYIDEVKQINKISGTQVEHGKYICVPYYSEEIK